MLLLFIYFLIYLVIICVYLFVDYRAGNSAGSKWLIDVNLTFQNKDQFTARGSDEVGSFTFKNGKITGACNIRYTKAYYKWCYFSNHLNDFQS